MVSLLCLPFQGQTTRNRNSNPRFSEHLTATMYDDNEDDSDGDNNKLL